MNNVTSYEMQQADIPKHHWDYNALPVISDIKNHKLITNYFSNQLDKNLYLHSSDKNWNDKVMSKVVFNFLFRSRKSYCISASWVSKMCENKTKFEDYGDSIGMLTTIPVLAIYDFGDESDFNYRANQNFIETIVSRRVFSAYPTLFCSRYSKADLIEKEKYSQLLISDIFSKCVVADIGKVS